MRVEGVPMAWVYDLETSYTACPRPASLFSSDGSSRAPRLPDADEQSLFDDLDEGIDE